LSAAICEVLHRYLRIRSFLSVCGLIREQLEIVVLSVTACSFEVPFVACRGFAMQVFARLSEANTGRVRMLAVPEIVNTLDSSISHDPVDDVHSWALSALANLAHETLGRTTILNCPQLVGRLLELSAGDECSSQARQHAMLAVAHLTEVPVGRTAVLQVLF
jgi:hypothetical protein